MHGRSGFTNYLRTFINRLRLWYYITVQAVTASGRYITTSSNGVIIDITPPEPIAPIDHFDVSFSYVQPINFQASNDTISVRWAFRDLQSGIVDYKWAIGTGLNTTDVQTFVSVGTSLEATNSGLLGVLEHNMTYYVTVVAVNGAGLSTYVTSDGVTYSASVLNFTALEEVVMIEFVRSLVVRGEEGEEEEEEVLVVEQEDRAAIMWDGVSEEVEDICELGELMRGKERARGEGGRRSERERKVGGRGREGGRVKEGERREREGGGGREREGGRRK